MYSCFNMILMIKIHTCIVHLPRFPSSTSSVIQRNLRLRITCLFQSQGDVVHTVHDDVQMRQIDQGEGMVSLEVKEILCVKKWRSYLRKKSMDYFPVPKTSNLKKVRTNHRKYISLELGI